MVVALLYEMQSPCNCFNLSLWRWRSKAQDDDGHIMSHILIACDVYLIMLLILLRTTVAL